MHPVGSPEWWRREWLAPGLECACWLAVLWALATVGEAVSVALWAASEASLDLARALPFQHVGDRFHLVAHAVLAKAGAFVVFAVALWLALVVAVRFFAVAWRGRVRGD